MSENRVKSPEGAWDPVTEEGMGRAAPGSDASFDGALSAFYRFFKKGAGRTPGLYRREHQRK